MRLRQPDEIVQDLLQRRQARSEIGAKQNFHSGLFEGLKTALAHMVTAAVATVKKNTFTVRVANQIELPKLQAVEDKSLVAELKLVKQQLTGTLRAIEKLEKSGQASTKELAKALKPIATDIQPLVKAINSIKIPEVKIPAPLETVKVENLDELKKPLSDLASKLKIEFPTINIPEYPETITVANLEVIESLLSEISTKTAQLESKETPQLDITPLIEATRKVQQSIDEIVFPIPNFSVPKNEDGHVPVSLEGSAFLDKYQITDKDASSDPKYYGFTDKIGNWYILKETVSAGTYRYATGTSAYTTNWTNRASLTYQYFYEAF